MELLDSDFTRQLPAPVVLGSNFHLLSLPFHNLKFLDSDFTRQLPAPSLFPMTGKRSSHRPNVEQDNVNLVFFSQLGKFQHLISSFIYGQLLLGGFQQHVCPLRRGCNFQYHVSLLHKINGQFPTPTSSALLELCNFQLPMLCQSCAISNCQCFVRAVQFPTANALSELCNFQLPMLCQSCATSNCQCFVRAVQFPTPTANALLELCNFQLQLPMLC